MKTTTPSSTPPTPEAKTKQPPTHKTDTTQLPQKPKSPQLQNNTTIKTKGLRWFSIQPLSQHAQNVLKAAFDTDYAPNTDYVNAYDFVLHKGNKGMDWWNFPWDLPSSKPKYKINYDDMKTMLKNLN